MVMTYTAGAPVSKAQAKSPNSQDVRTGRPATDWVPVGSSSRTTYTGRIPLASCARTTSPAETGGTGGRLPSNRSRDKRGIVTPSCRIALRRGLRDSLSPDRGGPQNTSAPPHAFGRPGTCARTGRSAAGKGSVGPIEPSARRRFGRRCQALHAHLSVQRFKSVSHLRYQLFPARDLRLVLVSIALASIGASRGLTLRAQIYHSFATRSPGACQEPDHKGNL